MVCDHHRNFSSAKFQRQNSKRCLENLSPSHVSRLFSFSGILDFLGGAEHSQRVQAKEQRLTIRFILCKIPVKDFESLCAKLLHGSDRKDHHSLRINSPINHHVTSDRTFALKIDDPCIRVFIQKTLDNPHKEIRLTRCTLSCESCNLVRGQSPVNGTTQQSIQNVRARINETLHIPGFNSIINDGCIFVTNLFDNVS